ncbi:MAG: molybdopterin molybdotransferase MoeA [Myxococcota bacterium]
MIPLDEALAHIRSALSPLPEERRTLSAALGAHLARPLRALLDHPRVDESAMDGYAVFAADVPEPGVRLPLHGESRAGGPPPDALPSGHAMRIFTGAALPARADAVIVQEDALAEDGAVSFEFAPDAGHHVRRRGSSCRSGDEFAPAGRRVSAGVVAAAASQGLVDLPVRVPSVVVLATGDELVAPGEPLQPGAIYDSNGPMALAMLKQWGGVEARAVRAGDSSEALQTQLEAARSSDLVLTMGGASVGAYDIVANTFKAAGCSFAFHGVAVKPGKPVAFGRFEGGPAVLMLPGNPVSAFVTFHVFADAALRALCGAPPRTVEHVTLAAEHRHRTGRVEFIRAAIDADGRACPFSRQNSGAMHDLARADVLIRLAADQAKFDEGATLPAIRLR